MAIKDWDGMASRVERAVSVPDDVGVINEHLEEIVSIADDVIDIAKDGWQYSDVVSFFEVVSPLMQLASTISTEWSEEKQDQFIVDTLYLIYQTVDGYPDGKQNNINIPVVFGSIEAGFEKRTMEFMSRAAIKALRSYIKNKQD